MDWYPEDMSITTPTKPHGRYPCCGYHCQTCSGDVSEDPYYCAKSSPKGTSFWFYTWQDCDFIYATRNPDTYCGQAYANCNSYYQGSEGVHTQLGEMAKAYYDFQVNEVSPYGSLAGGLWHKQCAHGRTGSLHKCTDGGLQPSCKSHLCQQPV